MTFEISSTYVKFAVDGEVGSGSIMIKTSADGTESNGAPAEDAVTLSFALRYLNLFNKAKDLSNCVKISMA